MANLSSAPLAPASHYLRPYSSLPDLDGRPRSAGGPPRHSASVALFFWGVLVFRHMHRSLVLALAVLTACGAATGPSARASSGVRTYLAALKSNDPHDAHASM